MMMNSWVRRKVSHKTFLSRLSDEEIGIIFSHGQPMGIAANGRPILQQDEHSPMLYVLTSGFTKILRTAGPGDRPALLDVCGPGDIVGLEDAILGSPAHAACLPIGHDVEILPISVAFFLGDVVREHAGIDRLVLETLARQLRFRDELKALQCVKPVDRRLDGFLSYLGQRHGVRHGDGVMVEIALTRNDIAQAMGVTVERLRPAIQKLEADRRLRLGSKHYYLNDEGRNQPTRAMITPIERLIPAGSPAHPAHS